jgi:hypothetical protein
MRTPRAERNALQFAPQALPAGPRSVTEYFGHRQHIFLPTAFAIAAPEERLIERLSRKITTHTNIILSKTGTTPKKAPTSRVVRRGVGGRGRCAIRRRGFKCI